MELENKNPQTCAYAMRAKNLISIGSLLNYDDSFQRCKIDGRYGCSRLLPPYGRKAAMLLSAGKKPRNDIFLFAGIDAWTKARAFEKNQITLCLPLDAVPFGYCWPVKDCPVLMFDTGELTIMEIERIAYCLLRANASIVRVVMADLCLVVYRRETA